MAEAEIYSLLNSRVPALGGRVYRLAAPQDTGYPCVVFRRLDTERVHAFGRDALPRALSFEIETHCRQAEGAESLDRVVADVELAISRYPRARHNVPPVAGGDISDILIEDEDEDYDDDTDLYIHTFDARVWYTPTPPASPLTVLAALSDSVPAASDFDIMPVGDEFSLARFTHEFLSFARLATEPDIREIVIVGDPTFLNQIGAWTKRGDRLTIGGELYNYWVSNQALTTTETEVVRIG